MPNEDISTAQEITVTRRQLTAASIIVVFLGNISGLLNTVSPGMRADGISGTEARAADNVLETRMRSNDEQLEAEIHRIDKIQARMELRMDLREAASLKCFETFQDHLLGHK